MKAEPLLEISGESGVYSNTDELNIALMAFADVIALQSNISVSLYFCPPEEMQDINNKFRGDNKTTDVISFPAEQMPAQSLSAKDDIRFLGEILIDINYIMHQTESGMLSMAVLQVFIHGLLHLVGYDHLNTQQKEIMQEFEHKIMDLTIQEVGSGR